MTGPKDPKPKKPDDELISFDKAMEELSTVPGFLESYQFAQDISELRKYISGLIEDDSNLKTIVEAVANYQAGLNEFHRPSEEANQILLIIAKNILDKSEIAEDKKHKIEDLKEKIEKHLASEPPVDGTKLN